MQQALKNVAAKDQEKKFTLDVCTMPSERKNSEQEENGFLRRETNVMDYGLIRKVALL